MVNERRTDVCPPAHRTARRALPAEPWPEAVCTPSIAAGSTPANRRSEGNLSLLMGSAQQFVFGFARHGRSSPTKGRTMGTNRGAEVGAPPTRASEPEETPDASRSAAP